MIDAVGPASYALRATHPDTTMSGLPLLAPSRLAKEYSVAPKSPDPRGYEVYGADREPGGIVTDFWVDRAEPQIRYLEVETTGSRHVLLPINYVKFDTTRHRINVRSILGSQFAWVPALSNPDQITRREEDQIMAYYASGNLYATAARAEPLL
jgi:photosynthetic reaction center H subunit